MKKILFCLLISWSCYSFCQPNDSLLRELRTVPIKGRDHFKLGDKIESIKDISYKTAAEHYNLKKGSLPPYDSVDIEVTRDNEIVAISFSSDTTYLYQKTFCMRYFQAPLKERTLEGMDLEMKVSRWEDKQTILELVEMKKADKILVYSTIFDKKLYYQKHKSVLEKEKDLDSYEVIKQFKNSK